MKIGIITFQKSLNYGSALQAWALSHVLQKMGADVQIIDYTPRHYHDLYGLFFLPKSPKKIAYNILHLIWLPFLAKRKQDFMKFQNEELPLSKQKYDSLNSIKEFTDQQEVMISGSDQIWNPSAKDFDMNFFLRDVQNVIKISYAASLGQGNLSSASNKEEILECLMDYDYISVREETGANKVRSFINNKKEVSVVLDPTLLLNAEDYKPIISIRKIDKPYIFFYSVRLNEAALLAAKQISKKKQLPVYTLMASIGNPRFIHYQKDIQLYKGNAGPSGFLKLIKDADFIVTDSFHGVAFSILFNKEFVAINRKEKSGDFRNDERIMNILQKLEIDDRYICLEEVENYNVTNTIDDKKVNTKIGSIREDSLKFLQESVFMRKK